MYRWRKLSEQDQAALLQWRQGLKRPWHSPPHFVEGPALFGTDLLATLEEADCRVFAWCVLRNHYHLLLHVPDLREATHTLGRLHGRTSHAWNGEDDQRGRKVWSAPADRAIRGDSHFWVTLNYIHHNRVKHGHVTRWQEWP
jgi:putative transposase